MSERPWFKHYDQAVPRSLEPYPAIPLYGFLEQAARDYPAHTALIFKPAHQGFAGSAMTYQALNDAVDRMAAALAGLGVKKGDRVAIFMPNSPQFVISYFAILKVGGAVVATNPLYSPREIEHQMNDSGAEIMLVMSNFYTRVKEIQSKTKLKTIVVANIKEYMAPLLKVLFTLAKEKKEGHKPEIAPGDLLFQDLLKKYTAADRPKVEVGPEDMALLQYTGGTTGVPKAAVALHRNLVANSLQIKSWMHDTRQGGEKVLVALPLFHVYGMVAALCYGMASAATLILVPNPRDIHNLLCTINQYQPTIFPGVPTMYNAINNAPDVGKYNIRSIRACISGSAPLLIETQTRFEQLTGGNLREGFGMSEAPTATHCNPITGGNRQGSIGLPLPDVDARIISLDDGVTELGPGEVGELVVRGPQVMQGYWNMPTETANVLRTLADGQVWLFTGDIAKMDEDGYFYIVDRKKDMVIAGGYNIYPREIEEVIKEHPKVLDVAAAGIPDPHRGETIKVWIVLKPGETMTAEEVKQFCQDKLARFKIPTHVEFRAELPKTMVGKVLRRMLVEEEKKKAGA